MSAARRRPPHEEPTQEEAAHVAAADGLVTRRRARPAPARLPPPRVADDRAATPAEIAGLRARLLQFALTLPSVALAASRLDGDAAGLFVRISRDDGTEVEVREFATLRTHPRWRLSVLLPMAATAELQRRGWGRPRPTDNPGPLMLELARPWSERDIRPLQRIIAIAYRAAAGDQARNR